jgi:hypothetical protein
MRKILPVLATSIFLLFIFSVGANAKEPLPRSEFIKYTDAALDGLDELEAALTGGSASAIDVRRAITKVDAALKKYDRYVKSWPECAQAHIAWQITKARLLFQTHLTLRSDPLRGYGDKELQEATDAAQDARDRFMEYRKEK